MLHVERVSSGQSSLETRATITACAGCPKRTQDRARCRGAEGRDQCDVLRAPGPRTARLRAGRLSAQLAARTQRLAQGRFLCLGSLSYLSCNLHTPQPCILRGFVRLVIGLPAASVPSQRWTISCDGDSWMRSMGRNRVGLLGGSRQLMHIWRTHCRPQSA